MRKSKRSVFKIFVFGFIGFWVVFLLVRCYLVEPFKIIYPDGGEERVLVNKLVYRLREPKVGERVIFLPQNDRSSRLVGYVLGFPGDESRFGLSPIDGRFVIIKWREKFLIVPSADVVGKVGG